MLDSLHPWAAFLIMPLFALANAGVNLSDVNVAEGMTAGLMLGVTIALVIGKPIDLRKILRTKTKAAAGRGGRSWKMTLPPRTRFARMNRPSTGLER